MLLAPKRLKFTNYIKESPELRRSRSRPRASKTMHTVRSSLPHTGRHAGRNTAHRLPRPLRRMNRLLLFVRVLIDSLHCFLVFLFFGGCLLRRFRRVVRHCFARGGDSLACLIIRLSNVRMCPRCRSFPRRPSLCMLRNFQIGFLLGFLLGRSEGEISAIRAIS